MFLLKLVKTKNPAENKESNMNSGSKGTDFAINIHFFFASVLWYFGFGYSGKGFTYISLDQTLQG